MLATDQQLEAMDTIFPLETSARSAYAKHFLSGHEAAVQHEKQLGLEPDPDHIDWREPRYLDSYGLWVATSYLLPASVTDTRHHDHRTSSPFQPAYGPFKIRSHTCNFKHAKEMCKKCGRFRPNDARGKRIFTERERAVFMAASPLSEDLCLPHTQAA